MLPCWTAMLLSLLLRSVMLSTVVCFAFPPAPPHVIFGLVRDEMGNPLAGGNATIYLETSTGVQIQGLILPNVEPGVNYRVSIPMDSGLTPDAYKPTALRPTVPFKIKVKLGNSTLLPIEMNGNYANLGQPGKTTRLDLTLGEDSDGDGLPDAWERLLMLMGAGNSLADIRPDDDFDHDGLSNYAEYLAGTYAWDPEDGLKLGLVRREGLGPIVQFFGIAGRTYSVQSTTNLVNWTTESVRVPAGNTNSPAVLSFYNAASQNVEVEVPPRANEPRAMFFRVRVN